ncbi:S53 family peptidase [Streptacidiphilus jiangxiensis]|uniref:Kumamolisin n=1 Tax=Streptacidiphilus jiangxiensis TaxID=235985 RepID=A0A1H7ZG55_STRJI|nr:S53 family serine peptidase [Streptacidiphilus jiangxiensis]SEM56427.1 kumamolisin [Streptacidiphilus jiangxiensis]
MKLTIRSAVGLLAAPLPILALALAVPAQATTTPAALHGDVLPAIAHFQRVGAVDARRSIPVTLSLALRDQAALTAFLGQVTDPQSPQYRHYLTVQQFADRFGATARTVARVTAYLRSQGLTVGQVSANHLSVQARGTAAQVEKAFGATLADYRDPASRQDFYANTAAPVLPAAIAADVTDVAGLNNYAHYHTNLARKTTATASPGATHPGLTPAHARSAYNVAPAIGAGYNGHGVTVGLLEFSAYTQSDVTTYDKGYALTPPTPVVRAAGGGTTDTSGQDEVELDIEVVQALAPQASVKVYEAPNSDAGELAVYAALVSDDVPVISTSWGQYEAGETPSNLTAVDTDLQEAAAQGQSVYAASGDSGSDDAGNGGTSVDFPAADPWVSGTGGTTLSLNSSGAWSKETAWSGSGGGVSSQFATPSFQSKVDTSGSRYVPDVAADANPSTGWSVYSQGAWTEYGGTSAAAPNWAAFTAIYDSEAAAKGKPSFGFANSTIYALAQSSNYSKAFHDVTGGSNGAYSAGTGYDRVTGWGSYNGANFLSAELG